jgi:hypothetical protein
VSLEGKSLSPTNFIILGGYEYTDAACTVGGGQVFYRFPATIGGTFSSDGAAFTSGVGTNSVIVFIRAYNIVTVSTIQDVLIDSVSLKAGSYRTPWVHNSGPGSSSYSARTYALHNVLSDSKPDGTKAYANGFCVGGWYYNDWNWDTGAGAETIHKIFAIPGTVGSNNRVEVYINTSSDEVLFLIYDSVGNYYFKYKGAITDIIWTGGYWKYFEACTSNTGTVIAHHYNVANSTWYPWSLVDATGTAIVNDQSTTMNFGSSGAGNRYIDGYISNICFAPFSSTYSNICWNNGTPPKRPY